MINATIFCIDCKGCKFNLLRYRCLPVEVLNCSYESYYEYLNPSVKKEIFDVESIFMLDISHESTGCLQSPYN